MLCLGPKKSLLSLRLELTAQGMGQHTNDQSQVWYLSTIQAPLQWVKDSFWGFGNVGYPFKSLMLALLRYK